MDFPITGEFTKHTNVRRHCKHELRTLKKIIPHSSPEMTGRSCLDSHIVLVVFPSVLTHRAVLQMRMWDDLEIRLWSRKQAISGNPQRSHYLSLPLWRSLLSPFFSQSSLSNCSFLRMTQMSSEQFESTFVGERCGEIWGDFRLLCSCSTSPHLISELKPKRESLHSLLFWWGISKCCSADYTYDWHFKMTQWNNLIYTSFFLVMNN